jgi:hypothetical protein
MSSLLALASRSNLIGSETKGSSKKKRNQVSPIKEELRKNSLNASLEYVSQIEDLRGEGLQPVDDLDDSHYSNDEEEEEVVDEEKEDDEEEEEEQFEENGERMDGREDLVGSEDPDIENQLTPPSSSVVRQQSTAKMMIVSSAEKKHVVSFAPSVSSSSRKSAVTATSSQKNQANSNNNNHKKKYKYTLPPMLTLSHKAITSPAILSYLSSSPTKGGNDHRKIGIEDASRQGVMGNDDEKAVGSSLLPFRSSSSTDNNNDSHRKLPLDVPSSSGLPPSSSMKRQQNVEELPSIERDSHMSGDNAYYHRIEEIENSEPVYKSVEYHPIYAHMKIEHHDYDDYGDEEGEDIEEGADIELPDGNPDYPAEM